MLDIRVIGELEVQLSGTKAELPARRRARALLSWLAVNPGRHHRSRLAGLFWPDVLDASARASLRSAIWALRSALGADFASYLATGRDTVTLAGEGLRVDLREFRRLAECGELEKALALCRGDLLQELDDNWVIEAREEFELNLVCALKALTEQASAAGDLAAALIWARRRASLRPLDQSAGADLIKVLIDLGDAPAALAAFAGLRQRLDVELGVTVAAVTAALVEPLGRRAASLRAPGPAARSVRPTATAPPPSGLIGRDRQFAELTRAWQAARGSAGTAVLLEGEGGIGKTCLVQELHAAAQRASPSSAVIAGTAAIAPGQTIAPFAIWTEALSDLVASAGRPA